MGLLSFLTQVGANVLENAAGKMDRAASTAERRGGYNQGKIEEARWNADRARAEAEDWRETSKRLKANEQARDSNK